jgi:hypothetical protein
MKNQLLVILDTEGRKFFHKLKLCVYFKLCGKLQVFADETTPAKVKLNECFKSLHLSALISTAG